MTPPKQLRFFSLFILLSAIIFCCKKSHDNTNADNGQLQIVSNPSQANHTNALQAVYTSPGHDIKGYYYGNFDNNGEPDRIKQMVIEKTTTDTAVNIFFDDHQRIKTLFLTHAGEKLNSLLSFDYSTAGKVTVSVHYFDFKKDSARLLYEYTVDINSSYPVVTNQVTYAYFGAGWLSLLQINTGGAPDQYGSQLITYQGALAAANAVIVAGSTAIGCLALGVPGCVIGGMIGDYLAHKPNAANASEVDAFPGGGMPGPYDQTRNTPWQNNYFYIGVIKSMGTSPIGGGNIGVQSGSDTWSNCSVVMVLDEQNNLVYGYINCGFVRNFATRPTPLIDTRAYFKQISFQKSGNSFTMTTQYDPTITATFKGSITPDGLSGSVTLNGHDSYMNYTFTQPILLKILNAL